MDLSSLSHFLVDGQSKGGKIIPFYLSELLAEASVRKDRITREKHIHFYKVYITQRSNKT